MKKHNSGVHVVCLRMIGGIVCALLLGISCSQTAKINETARQEAETTADEATAAYEKAQGIVSLNNQYSWQMAVEVNDANTRNEKFISAAKSLESARDKFLQASGKMNEALNGQDAFDNEQTTRLSRMSEAYKRWSDLAEFERKTWQEASTVSDEKALSEKLTAAQKTQKKMNDDLMSMMRGIS